MPELAIELENLLRETEAQIRKFPAAPDDDAQGEIIMLVSGFTRELASYVEGTPDDNGIHQAIRPLNRAFLAKIRDTAPKFSPFESGRPQSYSPSEFLPSDVEDDGPCDVGSPGGCVSEVESPDRSSPIFESTYKQPIYPKGKVGIISNAGPSPRVYTKKSELQAIPANGDDTIYVDMVMEMGDK